MQLGLLIFRPCALPEQRRYPNCLWPSATRVEMTVQTLHQQASRGTTLLRIVSSDDDEAVNDCIDDTYHRFSRL